MSPFDEWRSLVGGLATGTDLVFDLQGSESLMVEHLADVSSVEVEVRVREMHEGDSSDEDEHPGVLVALRVKRVVTELVTVRQVVDVVLFLPSVAASVR